MLSQSSLRSVWSPACRGTMVWVPLHGKGRVQVRATIIEAVHALNAQLVRWNYRTRASDTGAYVCRSTVGGSGYSLHAYGIALDINWSSNPYSRYLITDMPLGMVNAICGIRTNNGRQVWNWGGFWSGNKDAMHYEIVCSPRDLATGLRGITAGAPPKPKPAPIPTPNTPNSTSEDDDDMAHYVRNIVSGAIVRVAGNTKCYLDGPAFNTSNNLHKLLNGGNGIPVLDMTPVEFENYLRGMMWTNPGQTGS